MIYMKVLKKQALAACKFRGHDMKKFTTLSWDDKGNPSNCVSTCKNCGQGVQCFTNPAPNSISIGGPTVSVNCKKGESK
jgi:hypothetical protein